MKILKPYGPKSPEDPRPNLTLEKHPRNDVREIGSSPESYLKAALRVASWNRGASYLEVPIKGSYCLGSLLGFLKVVLEFPIWAALHVWMSGHKTKPNIRLGR